MAKSVLIVDDEFALVEVLEEALRDYGFDVRTAFNGKQALARIAEAQPDLIVTDYMMPVMDGPLLIGTLVANEDLRHIPILLISSLQEQALPELIGYKAFLRKPFRLAAFIETVKRLLAEAP